MELAIRNLTNAKEEIERHHNKVLYTLELTEKDVILQRKTAASMQDRIAELNKAIEILKESV